MKKPTNKEKLIASIIALPVLMEEGKAGFEKDKEANLYVMQRAKEKRKK